MRDALHVVAELRGSERLISFLENGVDRKLNSLGSYIVLSQPTFQLVILLRLLALNGLEASINLATLATSTPCSRSVHFGTLFAPHNLVVTVLLYDQRAS